MIFDRNENKQMIALLGAGSMGTAIVRRIAQETTSCRCNKGANDDTDRKRRP